MFRKSLILTAIVIVYANTGICKNKQEAPKGIASSGYYAAGITSLNDDVIAFLDQEPWKSRKAFRIELQSDVPATELPRLKKLPWIHKLYLKGIKDADLSVIKSLKNIWTLSISFKEPKNWDAVSTLPKLTVLEIKSQKNEIDIGFIENCKGLTKLDLGYSKKIKDYKPIGKLSKLKVLDLKGHKADETGLAPVGEVSGLEEISLANYTGKSLKFLSECTKLRNIVCGSSELSDISAVSKMPQLEDLRLRRTKVVDLKPLSKCQQLKNLDVSETLVTDLTPLSSLKKLQYLNLAKTKVIDLGS